jgi:DNA replication initiation complex subunit (GINS family)
MTPAKLLELCRNFINFKVRYEQKSKADSCHSQALPDLEKRLKQAHEAKKQYEVLIEDLTEQIQKRKGIIQHCRSFLSEHKDKYQSVVEFLTQNSKLVETLSSYEATQKRQAEKEADQSGENTHV